MSCEDKKITQLKIPDYLKLDDKGRYECSGCGETISKLFADLGCECDGEGWTKNYKEYEEKLEDAIWAISNPDLSGLNENEINNLKNTWEMGI